MISIVRLSQYKKYKHRYNMSINFGKSFDGFYGSNIASPSFETVAIEPGGYNHSLDSTESKIAEQQENLSNDKFTQYSLSQQHPNLYEETEISTPEQNQNSIDQLSSGTELEVIQIGLDANLESEIDNNNLGLSPEQAQKLLVFRFAPKINFKKVLRF